MITRREPLLWLQLMAIAVIPLELELLRLVLAGPAFGPVPSLERLLIWGLAVVAPGVLLWRRPADWASMIVVRVPFSRRSADQRRLSAMPRPVGLKIALAFGIVLLLPLFWWIDQSALLVSQWSPMTNSSRLTALLLGGPLLTLVLWEWQQLCQAGWLLTQDDQVLVDVAPINESDIQGSTLSLGLGVLQLPELLWPASDTVKTSQGSKKKGAETKPAENSDDQRRPEQDSGDAVASEAEATPQTLSAPVPPDEGRDATEEQPPREKPEPAHSASALAGSVEPEQSTEDNNGSDLNGEIVADDTVTRAEAQSHDEQAESARSKQSEPEQSPEPPPGSA